MHAADQFESNQDFSVSLGRRLVFFACWFPV